MPKAGAPAAAPAAAGPAVAAQIDVNSAAAEQLRTLEGIGEARAAAIIKNRPYANKTQLVSKGVLPQAVYDKIASKIVAKQL